MHHLLHPRVDFLDQLLVIPVGFKGLAEREQVLLAVVADQRFHDGLFTGANARVTQLSQLKRIAFSGKDCVHDGQAGGSIEIADDVMNLQIHPIQRLLHVLEMKGGQLDEIVAMTPQRTDRANFGVGTKGTTQQSRRMKVLNPLAVGNIGLSARHVLDVMGVDQSHVDLALFQNLEKRNPVHSGRLHGYGPNLALLKPVRQSFQIDGEGGEAPDRLWIAIRGHGHEDLRGAYIDSRGVGLDHGQADNLVALLSTTVVDRELFGVAAL